MSDSRVVADATLPCAFVEQVQHILEHLHDFPYLLTHPFAEAILRAPERLGESSGQQLRREVMQAVEALSPGPGICFRAPHARIYNLLHLHYVEGMTIQEAANELNISLRQAYRDLRHGEESVAALLWPRMRQDEASAGSGSVLPEPTQASALEEEMQRLDKRSFAINLCQLVLRAHKAVDRLAVSLGVQCQVDMPAQPVMVVTDQVVAQQALVSLLSHAIQDAVPGQLSLRLKANGTTALLTVRHHLREGAAPLGTTVAQLADRLHWPLPQVTEGEGIREVLLRIPVGGATILVIDDNEGLGDLFSRYLAGHPFHVIQANNGPDGLDIARQLHPDVIVLDVMMPDLDGWEVLQTLRAEPSTAGIPVIVCSVIDDPQLAQSLGASSSLTKPVGRDDILRVLHALHLT